MKSDHGYFPDPDDEEPIWLVKIEYWDRQQFGSDSLKSFNVEAVGTKDRVVHVMNRAVMHGFWIGQDDTKGRLIPAHRIIELTYERVEKV